MTARMSKQNRRETIESHRPSAKGQHYEDYAHSFLKKAGLVSISRNYRCRLGEIDLIMLDGDTLVFVEVKYRKRHCHGSSVEQVDYRKQQKLQRTALIFLSRNPHHAERPCRFDVMGISPIDGALHVDWIKDAL